MAKAKQITNEQRQKVITDYAIATGVKRSYNLNDNNEATGAYVVDEKVTKNGESKITFVTANGILKENGTQTTGLGAAPVVSIPVSTIAAHMINNDETVEELLGLRQIADDYVVEIGESPKTRAEDALQAQLAKLKKKPIDGYVEYDGKKYKAATISAADPDVVARYADGTIDENGKVVFFEVEPIRFVVANYADLPPMLNPKGTGKAETLDLIPAQIIMSYDEYKEHKYFFDEEFMEPETFWHWIKKSQEAIIKLISKNPANVNIIPTSLILDDKFMAKVNEVLAENYQKEFKAGMKKKDAKKIKKEAKNTSQLVSSKVEKAKAQKAAEEAKAKAEEEAKAKEKEEKNRPTPTEDKKDKKEKKAKKEKAPKEKKPEGKIKKKLKNILSLAKDAFSKLGTLSGKKADTYQKQIDEMFSTQKSTKPAQAKPKNNTPKVEPKKEEPKAEPKTAPKADPKKKRPAGAAEDDRTK